MNNNNIIMGAWRALHNEYATVEELDRVISTNTEEHKELRDLITNNHDEIKTMLIDILVNK